MKKKLSLFNSEGSQPPFEKEDLLKRLKALGKSWGEDFQGYENHPFPTLLHGGLFKPSVYSMPGFVTKERKTLNEKIFYSVYQWEKNGKYFIATYKLDPEKFQVLLDLLEERRKANELETDKGRGIKGVSPHLQQKFFSESNTSKFRGVEEINKDLNNKFQYSELFVVRNKVPYFDLRYLQNGDDLKLWKKVVAYELAYQDSPYKPSEVKASARESRNRRLVWFYEILRNDKNCTREMALKLVCKRYGCSETYLEKLIPPQKQKV